MPGVWVDQWLEALFPARCALCGLSSGGHALCSGCREDLPWLGDPCPRCALPRTAGADCALCPPGLLAYRQVHAPLAYAFPLDQLVLAAKFGRQPGAALALGELLAHRLAPGHPPPDLVLPVPLHWRRQASRGFNQAEEMARRICRLTGWRLHTGLCQRVRPTAEQARLGAAARGGNLRGAFVAEHLPRGLHLLVVDDVLTTGATAAAMAEALLARGAVSLTFWAAARALAHGPDGHQQAGAKT